MARPKLLSDQEVLRAAARVVARSGPARLTLGAVAAEAGLSPATLVQRFGSKRGLLLALSAGSADTVEAAFARARERHDDPHDAVVAALVGLTEGVRTPEALANSVAFLALDLADPEFLALAQRHAGERRRAIVALLGDEDLARAVDVAYNGSLITWAVDREGNLPSRLEADLRAVLSRAR
jgi:AcrR family transcriptional regulator